MKPFIGGVLTIAVIAVISSFVLENQKMSAQDIYQSQSGKGRLDSGTN
jgi:hypothetical protein